ncbi:hypothetical protein SA58113_0725 [Staphylococcus argenteus]|nr:hypothetical protein SA58113_0725 [Staphylococcus argenteus]
MQVTINTIHLYFNTLLNKKTEKLETFSSVILNINNKLITYL